MRRGGRGVPQIEALTFYNLISLILEGIYHDFCHMLLVTDLPWYIMGGDYKRSECHEMEIVTGDSRK